MNPLPQVWPTVIHMLADAARAAPAGEALRCDGEVLDYQGFAACASGLAHELQAMDAGTGSRVILLMANSIDIAIATFGVQAAGAQVAPLNPAYSVHELAPIFEDAQAAAILYDIEVGDRIAPLLERFAPDRRIAIGPGARRLTDWRDDPDLAKRLPLPNPEALSTLQYTGGTTGRSKGVNLTHRSVALNISQREALLPMTKDAERVLAITPLFHVYAVAMGLYLAVYCRASLVILKRYTPERVLQAVEQYRITLMSGSPTIFIGVMACDGFRQADLSSLRLCFSGAAALSEETLRRWETATGCIICEGYGQSESGPVLSFNPSKGRRKPGTVGIAVPGVQIEIVDVETGKVPMSRGELGEIRVAGEQIMQGYRNLPEQTAEALRDGWLFTGDIGRIDADGYLSICDRKKEMAIVGGFNVYPREVEEALFTHPDIREAAVVGVPDEYRGEALVAFVIVAADSAVGAPVLLDYLDERLVRYKIPREIRIVETLPKTTVGKLDRKQLRAALTAEEGAATGPAIEQSEKR